MDEADAERLDALVDELSLSAETAFEIEREVTGYTVREVLWRQDTEEQERRRYLDERHDRGIRYMDAWEWRQAVECFEEIQHLEPGYRDAGSLLSEARQRQSTDQEERARPDDSTDARRRSSLPALAESWWVLASRGLVVVIFGLLIAVLPGKENRYSFLGYGLLIMADGVLANMAIRGAGRRPLLRIQSRIGVLAGVVILIAAGLLLSLPREVTFRVPLIKIILGSFAVWAVCIGIIRIVTAVRLGWEFKVVRLMIISGALLIVVGILTFSGLGNLVIQDLRWPRAILLLASGVTLVAFAFRVRNLQGSGAAR